MKAGSILPRVESLERAYPGGERQGDRLILHLYPQQSGEYHCPLYSDAGEGYGDSRVDHFYLTQQAEELHLTWEKEGAFAFPDTEVFLHLHGATAENAWIDGQQKRMQGQRLHCHLFQQVCLQIDGWYAG